jgi:flagellar basal body-associated protein FliL
MVLEKTMTCVSGETPMAAFEFFVEGLSSEVLVEMKDREGEMRDLFQRQIEEFSFEQLDTTEGKKLLLERLKKAVNNSLSQGRIRRIFIKNVVLKP